MERAEITMGGMFCGPSSNVTEEDSSLSEWNSKERAKYFHEASLKFANNSTTERGKRVRTAPTAVNASPAKYDYYPRSL